MFRRRTIILGFVFFLGFAAMAARLWQLQVVRGEYYTQMGEGRLHRLRQIPPARGRILDRRGRVVAEDVASFELWFRPASYTGRGRNRQLRSNFAELEAERIIDIIASEGSERELKHGLALQTLTEREPLVKALADILRAKDETPQQARQRVARTLLEAALLRGDSDLSSLNDPRRCFSDLPVTAVLRIEQAQADPYAPEDLSSLEIRGGYRRSYPYGEYLGHVTGHVGNLSAEDYRRLRGRWLSDGTLEIGSSEIVKDGRVYFSIDPGSDEEEMIAPRLLRRAGNEYRAKGYFANEVSGREGVEQWYNNELRGRHVWRIERMARPDPAGPRIFVESGPPRQAVNGSDIMLTIDAEFQKKVTDIFNGELRRLSRLPEHQRALYRQGIDTFVGAAVVLNPNSGEVYALVSLPNYDPNTLSEDFRDLLKDRRKPFINRTIAGSYPPGSTIKPLVAIAALEEGKVTPHTHHQCDGWLTLGNRDYVCMNRVAHGSIEITDALKSSCNVFFYRAGEALGGKLLVQWLRDLGLGRQTGIDIPGERPGHLPEAAFSGRGWSLGQTYHLSIGQGAIDATPLQMAVAYSTFLNGGRLLRPHVRYDPADPHLGEPVSQTRLDPQNVATVTRGMWKVIQARGYPRGTASQYAYIKGFEYIGKTGSAQKDRRSTHAWMVAAAPYHKPEIAVCVIVPYGNHGGSTCGVIIRRIVEAYFNLKEYITDDPGALPEGGEDVDDWDGGGEEETGGALG